MLHCHVSMLAQEGQVKDWLQGGTFVFFRYLVATAAKGGGAFGWSQPAAPPLDASKSYALVLSDKGDHSSKTFESHVFPLVG